MTTYERNMYEYLESSEDGTYSYVCKTEDEIIAEYHPETIAEFVKDHWAVQVDPFVVYLLEEEQPAG